MSNEDAAGPDQHLAEQFEAHRAHLLGVAYRVLGAGGEAQDAVQEAWLRLQRTGAAGVDNLGGRLTTVVARVCLDMLRSRAARREEPLDPQAPDAGGGPEPEAEAVLAESVGRALMVVLDTLTPPERLAFVLHDLFAVPFEEVAAVLDRSPVAARQLASRARRRVREIGPGADDPTDGARRENAVRAFLAAARGGDFGGLMAVLDPDIVLRADTVVPALGGVERLRGREQVARAFLGKTQAAQEAFVDGAPGAVFTPDGRVRAALEFVVRDGRITSIEVVSDPEVVAAIEVALS